VSAASPEPGGLACTLDDAQLATVCCGTRLASRLLVRVAEFRATAFAMLYKQAAAVDWARWVAPGTRLRLRVTCKKSRLYHSDAVAERVGQAIAAAVPGVTLLARAKGSDDEDEATGDEGAAAARAAASTDDADVQLVVVRLLQDVCTISLDAAGEALHRRGWRQAVAKAPLRETLAAAMLAGAGWDGSTALVDPLCGSGTLIIEGALLARGMTPGRARAFAAERWPAGDATAWRVVRARFAAAERPAAGVPLQGSDRDAGAVRAALANAARAGVADDVSFTEQSLSDCEPPAGAAPGLLVMNPPYGIRVGEADAVRDLYARIGQLARVRFGGWTVALLSADRTPGHTLERQLRLPLRPVWRASNGGIPVRLLVGQVPRGGRDR
jgi:putative N6-adenine-specific DNA methylase